MQLAESHHGKVNMLEAQITLNQQMIDEMHSEAVSTYPEECCGLMFGKFEDGIKMVSRVKGMRNDYRPSERYHRYTIDPKDFLAAEKEADLLGEDIVGIYHSHPNAPPKPSEFDRNHAWPSLSYIVMEVRERKVLNTFSWTLKEDRSEFIQEKMQVMVK